MPKSGDDAHLPADDEGAPDPRPIVAGIGASAGGLEALQSFFDKVPDDLGISYVVIVHLSPEHRSQLAEILGTRTSMPVCQVTEVVALEKDHIYVIPPDRQLALTDSSIGAYPFEDPRGQRAPIDVFFRSLARQHGDGFAMVFSGGGHDGAVGIRAVKEAGGIILVQDPKEASHPSMPLAAIATGAVDLVLPIGEMAARLGEMTSSKRALPAEGGGEGPSLSQANREVVRHILAHLHARTRHDFTRYKPGTVLRRIRRRMHVLGAESPDEYLHLLRERADEAQALFDDLLIPVTSFFRDADAFATLQEKVVRPWFDEGATHERIRVWIPACASGEEAYSLAMLILDAAGDQRLSPDIQIFASDLDARGLAAARTGRYPAAIEADVPQPLLKRYFHRDGDDFHVVQEVRDCILFASHSLLRDPPFSQLDLVSCRNLLIYLDRDLQAQVFRIFRYALRSSGHLFLGSSEHADPQLFHAVDKKHRIYSIKDSSPGDPPLLPELLGALPRRDGMDDLLSLVTPARPAVPVHHRALEETAPPSMLVDSRRTAVNLSERAGRYLLPPGGAPTADVARLLRPELQTDVMAALHRALENHETTITPFVPVGFNGTPCRVAVHVGPVEGDDGARLALLTFLEAGEAKPSAETSDDDVSVETFRALREELESTRKRMRLAREEHATASEELRASNEELHSINEEYRSTTEELETSKEELRSINEELEALNNELRHKLDDVARANSDLENLMAATDIGTLFLDNDLSIQRFTPRILEIFNVAPSDQGRAIRDFTHHLAYQGLEEDARRVLDTLVPIERETSADDDRWYLVRIRPYRAGVDRIEGIVVSFVDVSERKAAELALWETEARYRLLVDTVEEYAIFTVDPDGEISTWNKAAGQIFGYDEDAAVGASLDRLFIDEDRENAVPSAILSQAEHADEAKLDRWHRRRDGTHFWGSGVVTSLRAPNGDVSGFAVVLRDSTAVKASSDALVAREANQREVNETLECRVLERTEDVRRLAGQLTLAEQRERRRLSRVLHDDLQQLLYGIQLRLAQLIDKSDGADERLRERAREADGWLDEAILITRRLTVDLSPPILEGEGLADALGWLRSQMADLHDLEVVLHCEEDIRIRDADCRILLFQAIRELLFNVVKHARTNEARVDLYSEGDTVVVRVADRGCGFDDRDLAPRPDDEETRFGLWSIRERLALLGGEMTLDTRPEGGASVTLRMPDAAVAAR